MSIVIQNKGKHKVSIRRLAIFLLTILFSNVIYSQVQENACDTIEIKAPAYLILNDTSIHVLTDSSVVVCERYVVLTKKNGYSLYSKLIAQTEKHVLLEDLFQSLLQNGGQDTMLIKIAGMKAEEAYTPFSGNIIRRIKIQVLDPLGSSVGDTSLPAVTKWGNALNKSHIKTSNLIVKQKLFFKENDTINPFQIVETTRVLTDLQFVQDVSIVVFNTESDSVDVLVLVKDKFPWMPSPRFYTVNHMMLYLKNVNMFGLGQSLGVGINYDKNSSPNIYVSDINYYIDNIYKQISGAVNYHISDYDRLYQIILNRELIPFNTQTGGGLEISQREENIGIDPTYHDKSAWYFKYRFYEVWASYLINNDQKNKRSTNKKPNFIPGITINKKQYLYRPFVSADSNNRFVNISSLLGNLALVKQSYYRTNYIANFGQAEYIPYGYQLSLTTGYSFSEFRNRPYLGMGGAFNVHFERAGFLWANFDIGSYIDNGMEQGAVFVNMSFLSDIFKIGMLRNRLLVKLNYTDAINRYTNDMLYLGDDYGFLEIDETAWYGRQRLFFDLTYISYAPFYLLGFRFAVYGFAGAALLGSDKHSIFYNQVLGSIGLGTYIKNDFLAFAPFQIRFAYYPITPEGESHFGISFLSNDIIKQFNFLHTKPHIVEYR